MDTAGIAEALLARAVDGEQAVMRCDSSTPTEEIRAGVRHLARARGISIRTGMVGDVLAIVRTDARVWQDNATTMRVKLSAPDQPNVIA